MTKKEWENRLKVLGLPAFEYPYRINDADKEAFFRRIMERYARAPEPGDPGFSADVSAMEGAGIPYSLVSKPRIPSEVTVSPEDVQTWVGGNILPDGQVVLANEEILPSLQATPEQIAPPDFYDEPFHIPTSVQDLASQVVTGSSYANKPPPLDELTPFTSTAPTAARTLPSVQDITPLPRMAPPIDELSFTRAAPTAAPTLPPVQDITPFLPRRQTGGDAALAESLSPYMGPTSISRVSEAPEGYTQLPSGVEAPPPEIPYGVQVDEGMEGYVPERAETDAGIQFATTLDEATPKSEYDVAIDTGEITVETPTPRTELDVDSASDPFMENLRKFVESGAGFPQFPTDPSMNPNVIRQRQQLQRRRNVLRGLYGQAPKDIVWNNGMTTTQMSDLWKRQVDQYLGTAYAMTSPVTNADVNLLGQALNLPLSSWETLLDMHKKARPDYAYAKAAEEYYEILDKEGEEEAMKRLMSGTFQLYPNDPVLRNRFIQGFFAKYPHLRTKENLELLSQSNETFAGLVFEPKKYSMPWRLPDTPEWRAVLGDMNVKFSKMAGDEKDFINPYGTAAWLKIAPGRTVTLNPKDATMGGYLAKLQGMPGFGVISEAGKQIYAVGPSGKPVSGFPVFNESNESYKDYVNFMSRNYGWQGSMPESVRGQQYQTGVDVLKDPDFRQARDDKQYAGKIVNIVDTILGLQSQMSEKYGDEVDILGTRSGASLWLGNIRDVLASWDPFGFSWLQDAEEKVSDVPTGLAAALSDGDSRKMLAIAQDGVSQFGAIDFDEDSTGAKLQSDFSSALSKNLTELSKNPSDLDQARIMTNVMGLALGTLMARLFSRNDRLLKQQYQDFRELMDLSALFVSPQRAISRIKGFQALAAIFEGTADDRLQDYERKMAPSDWQMGTGGFYFDARAARKKADALLEGQ